ncbi:MAG TPA: peptidoglycan DD-metalloendopeptidase family protein [Rhodanobacter sp.]|nr:peptidoglycan DD-metalloendopeptidase family protein [Rhodanobacter sp.]
MNRLFVFLLGVLCGVAALFYLTERSDVASAGQGSVDALQDVVVTARPSVAATTLPSAAVATLSPPRVAWVDPPQVAPPDVAPGITVAPASDVPVPPAEASTTAVYGLLIPVAGVAPADLVDTFTQARGEGRVHDAIDIMAPRGTPVVAVNDGRVVKLFTSKPGGLTVYQFDPQQQVVYYYAHLDGYAPGLAEGQLLHRGDPLGFVGSTGNASADAPHLHFEIQLLGPEKQWWHATSINPYGRFVGQP